ncbi:protein FAR1-RELATED SEQUENCE 6-like [Papaver somniferum]|uniref:protein FAR1-RELATED SEQUENCE 6-like n=1 Tax=Papaver somniferum TaxID=3469 RepID=UPI000E7050A2|nr:protein FAR1-RELATED SEQUENCE 6-like [Papaver somniferum]
MMNDSSKESDSNENLENQYSLKSKKLKHPVVGVTFHRWGDMLKFYQEYASRVGFSIVKRSTRNNGDGILRGVTFACSKHLSKSRRKTTENGIVQSRCDAYITAKLEKCEHWRISVASLEHNHKCDPSKFSSKRCVHRHIESLERKIHLNIPADIATNVDPDVVCCCGDEPVGCIILKHVSDSVNESSSARLGRGDATTLIRFFQKMVGENAGFYFVLDVDDVGQLKSVFWVDGMSREAYKEFGEVVSFDTSYLVKEYEILFASFIGVNHHGQTILLGCGLLWIESLKHLCGYLVNG